MLQKKFLRSEFVADMLLKISGVQMSNKSDAKRQKWRKMTVGLKTRKPLTSKGFSYQCLFLIIVVCMGLFANTKLTKNRTKYIRVHINVACDVSEVTHRCTDVHRDEVARGADV